MKKIILFLFLLSIATTITPKKEEIKIPTKIEQIKRFPGFSKTKKAYYTLYQDKAYRIKPKQKEIKVYEAEGEFSLIKNGKTDPDKLESLAFKQIGKYSFSKRKWKKLGFIVKGLGMVGKAKKYKLPKKILKTFEKKYPVFFEPTKAPLFPQFVKKGKSHFTYFNGLLYKITQDGKKKKIYIYKKKYTKDSLPGIKSLKTKNFIEIGEGKNKKWRAIVKIKKGTWKNPPKVAPIKEVMVLPNEVITKYEQLHSRL